MELTPADGLERSVGEGIRREEDVRLAWLSMLSVSRPKKISANMSTAFEDGIEARTIVDHISSDEGAYLSSRYRCAPDLDCHAEAGCSS